MSQTLNITPIMITEDPNPTASTACGMLGFSVLGTQNDWPGSMMTSEMMITRPVLKEIIDVPINTDSGTLLKTANDILPVGDVNEWRKIPLSCYQYVNGQITFRFQAMCSSELKGIFSFHVYDYTVDVDQDFATDPTCMRNRVETWNLEEDGPEFTLTINPVSRFKTKCRYHPKSDYGSMSSDYGYYIGGVNQTSEPVTKLTHSDADLVDGARFYMYLHSKLQSTINLPDKVSINIWQGFSGLGTAFPKAYPELENELVGHY